MNKTTLLSCALLSACFFSLSTYAKGTLNLINHTQKSLAVTITALTGKMSCPTLPQKQCASSQCQGKTFYFKLASEQAAPCYGKEVREGSHDKKTYDITIKNNNEVNTYLWKAVGAHNFRLLQNTSQNCQAVQSNKEILNITCS